jgi:hypothetical protein
MSVPSSWSSEGRVGCESWPSLLSPRAFPVECNLVPAMKRHKSTYIPMVMFPKAVVDHIPLKLLVEGKRASILVSGAAISQQVS